MSSSVITEKIDELLDNGKGDSFPSEKLKHIKWVLKESDQELIPNSVITMAIQNLNNAKNYLNNPAQFQKYVDSIVSQFSSPWNKKRPKAETQKIIDEIREDANSAISETTQRLDGIDDEIEKKNDELDNLNNTLEAIRAKIDTESQRLDSMVTNEQAALADKKVKIDEDNSAFIEKTKEEITNKANIEVENFKAELASDVTSLKEEISVLRDESKSDQSKIRELLKIASDDTLTKDYSDLSREEKQPAKNWSDLAVASFLSVPVTAVIVTLCYGIPDELSLNSLLVRFSLPFSFLIIGIYASKKSSHHRDTHLRAKRTHIRFSTLEPYLEKFNPEKRDEIREQLIDEFFKEKEPEKVKSPFIGLSVKQVSELIEQVRSTLNQQ